MLDTLEVFGLAIILGFFVSLLSKKIKMPAVGGYVTIGVILGSSVLNIFTNEILDEMTTVNSIALGLIALVIGGELKFSHLKKLGKSVFIITFLEAFGAFIIVTSALQALFGNLPLSLLLGSVAAATAPAATVMVIEEMEAKGKFTKTLLAVVAIDDAIALFIFGICAALSANLIAQATTFSIATVVSTALFQIGGAVLLGLLGGLLTGPVIRKFRKSEWTFILVMGTLFLILGISERFHISELLSSMVFGMVLTNMCPMASHHVFTRLAQVTSPLFIAFFVTAGAHLRLDILPQIWLIGLVYIICRIIGKIGGARLGGWLSNAPEATQKYIGFGLLSQVGVAIGLAMVVSTQFSQLGAEGKHISNLVINILLTTTVFTEIIGPLMTRYALTKTGDAFRK